MYDLGLARNVRLHPVAELWPYALLPHGHALAAKTSLRLTDLASEPLVLINPELVWTSPTSHLNEEGCLSVPGIYDGVQRFDAVQVRALDGTGKSRVIEADGLLSVCIQHEMDHLMGRVFVEYLSPLKRKRIKTKMLKAQREAER
jgi:peptide deformylase